MGVSERRRALGERRTQDFRRRRPKIHRCKFLFQSHFHALLMKKAKRSRLIALRSWVWGLTGRVGGLAIF